MKKFYIYADLHADGGEVYEVEAASSTIAVYSCTALWRQLDEDAKAGEDAEVNIVISAGPDFAENPEIFVASAEMEITRSVVKPTKTADQKARLLSDAKSAAADARVDDKMMSINDLRKLIAEMGADDV